MSANSDEPPRRALSEIDLDELTMVRSNEEGGCYNPADGTSTPRFMGELLGADDESIDPDEAGWIGVDRDESHVAYGDMEDFADAVADPRTSDYLARALDGRGPFRRFRDEISRQPEELGGLWYRFSDARCESRAIEWLAQSDLVDEAEAEAAQVERADAWRLVLEEAARWRPSDN